MMARSVSLRPKDVNAIGRKRLDRIPVSLGLGDRNGCHGLRAIGTEICA